MEIQNIYGIPPPQPEEHHKAIESLNTIVQGTQTQSYKLEELAQENSVITSSNSSDMAQLAQMTVTMNAMQAQLKTLSEISKQSTRKK